MSFTTSDEKRRPLHVTTSPVLGTWRFFGASHGEAATPTKRQAWAIPKAVLDSFDSPAGTGLRPLQLHA